MNASEVDKRDLRDMNFMGALPTRTSGP
jgi:hypothetical protein